MSNALLTPTKIAKEALFQLKNNLVMGALVHREYKEEFLDPKAGGTVTIRKPVKFVASDGATRVNQDVTEGSTSITIDKRKHVSWKFNTNDLTLSIEEYSKRYIAPAMIALAQEVETSLCGLYANVWRHAGTPGTVPSGFSSLSAAALRLDNGAVPAVRHAVLNPEAAWTIANGLTGNYVSDKAKTALERGKIGMLAGFDTYSAQSIRLHTVGAYGGTPLIKGASQVSTYASVKDSYTQTLLTDGWTPTTGALAAGDVFTIAGVYAVNPVTKQSTGQLANFVVNAAATADGSGNMSISISPPIITSGAYQTVDAAPADNAAISVKGTASTAYAQNLCFHKNAFALVTTPLELPDGAAFKSRESADGLSVRVVKDYDIENDEDIIRLDILYGVKAIYPELACRLTS